MIRGSPRGRETDKTSTSDPIGFSFAAALQHTSRLIPGTRGFSVNARCAHTQRVLAPSSLSVVPIIFRGTPSTDQQS
ncbi:hypothetical protein CBM2598_U40019 [Cupriavidus taiwanensis]|nr:hypothetical protein CBM2598_U40019 [Cupriavidus taiwanensis]